MNEYEKAQIMSKEMDRLRQEITVGARATHKLVVVFLTVFVGILSIYFGKGLVDEVYKAILILLISQIEVILCIFCASLFSYQYVRIGYAHALEEKINDLAKDNLVIWHSKISRRYMAHYSCAFFFASVLQYLAYTLIFCVLSYFTFKITNNFLCGALFTIEAVVCLGLHIWASLEIKKVTSFAKKEQNEERK